MGSTAACRRAANFSPDIASSEGEVSQSAARGADSSAGRHAPPAPAIRAGIGCKAACAGYRLAEDMSSPGALAFWAAEGLRSAACTASGVGTPTTVGPSSVRTARYPPRIRRLSPPTTSPCSLAHFPAGRKPGPIGGPGGRTLAGFSRHSSGPPGTVRDEARRCRAVSAIAPIVMAVTASVMGLSQCLRAKALGAFGKRLSQLELRGCAVIELSAPNRRYWRLFGMQPHASPPYILHAEFVLALLLAAVLLARSAP